MEAPPVERSPRQCPRQRVAQVIPGCPCGPGVLEKVDGKPLGRRAGREGDAAEDEAPPAETERSGTLAVVDERRREDGGRSEPECIPMLRAGEDEGGAVQEGAHQLLVPRGDDPETPPAWVRVETMGEGDQLSLPDQAFRQAGRVCSPTGEFTRPVDTARAKLGMGSGRHVVCFFRNNTYADQCQCSRTLPPSLPSTTGSRKEPLHDSGVVPDAVQDSVVGQLLLLAECVDLCRAHPQELGQLPHREQRTVRPAVVIIRRHSVQHGSSKRDRLARLPASPWASRALGSVPPVPPRNLDDGPASVQVQKETLTKDRPW